MSGLVGFALAARLKVTPRRRGWHTTSGHWMRAARRWTLQILRQFVTDTIKRPTTARPTNKNWNGRGIYRTCEQRSNEL